MSHRHAREYASSRSELHRTDGSLWGTLWEKSGHHRSCQQILQLLGFFLAGRLAADVSSVDLAARISVESACLGSFVCDVPAVWQRKRDAPDASDFEGVARIVSTTDVSSFSDFAGGTDSTRPDAETRRSQDALIQGLRSKQVLTATNHWNFMSWDQHCLRPNKQEPLSSECLHEMLQTMVRLTQRLDLIHRFAAMKPMPI